MRRKSAEFGLNLNLYELFAKGSMDIDSQSMCDLPCCSQSSIYSHFQVALRGKPWKPLFGLLGVLFQMSLDLVSCYLVIGSHLEPKTHK